MARVLLYYAHPGQRYSIANKPMFAAAQAVDGITTVDLYAECPRFGIPIDREQQRLLEHDVIVFQYPMYWYSTPSLVKEWLDLVLEHGFAYGEGGDKLTGKTMMLAVTAAGSEDAYSETGYQRYAIRTFLTPMERTAGLCKMRFAPPYVLFGALQTDESSGVRRHVDGYRRLLEALRDDRYDFGSDIAVASADTLPILEGTA